MSKGIKNKNTKENLDSLKNDSIKSASTPDLSDPSDLADKAFAAAAEQAKAKKPAPKAENKIPDLKTKYPSRTLEDLRKMDFIHQYESKFPNIERPGYVTAWICNTPNKNNRDIMYRKGYDYMEGIEPVASGYSDQTGEDRFAHYAMQIPEEIYKKQQKALSDMTNKMYGHILKPDKKGRDIDGDGMYDPKGREVKTVGKVLTNE